MNFSTTVPISPAKRKMGRMVRQEQPEKQKNQSVLETLMEPVQPATREKGYQVVKFNFKF